MMSRQRNLPNLIYTLPNKLVNAFCCPRAGALLFRFILAKATPPSIFTRLEHILPTFAEMSRLQDNTSPRSPINLFDSFWSHTAHIRSESGRCIDNPLFR